MTSRELGYSTLEGTNTNDRVPRDIWLLRWTIDRYKEEVDRLQQDFKIDIEYVPFEYQKNSITKGNPTKIGIFVDAHVKQMIQLMTTSPRYVLGVADQVVPGASVKRIRRVRELVDQYGKY